MKKTTKKLLLKKETVRNLSAEQMQSAAGGTLNVAVYSGGCNSGGISVPGPSKSTDAGALLNYAASVR